MYCPNCGRELREGEVCNCRNTTPNEYAAGYQQPVYGAPSPYPVYPDTSPATPAIEILRRYGSSPLMLALVILLGAGWLFSSISVFFSADYGSAYAYQYGMHVEGLTNVMGFLSFIPSALITVGVLLFYLNCRNPKTQLVSTAGLTMVQVLFIVSASFLGLFCLLALIGLGIGGAGLSYSLSYLFDFDSSLMNMIIGFAMVFLLVFVAFYVIYFIFLMKTISAVKQTARTGVENIKVSMFIAVMCFIFGAFSVFGSFAQGFTFTMVASLISGAASIVAGILLVGYRREIINLAMARANSYPGYQQPEATYTQNIQPGYVQPQEPEADTCVCQNCGVYYPAGMDQCPACGTANPKKE